MAALPTLPIQFSVPVEARKDLRRLALDISDDIVPDGELRYTEMCSYAALHLLSCDKAEVLRIVNAGMAHEEKYDPNAAAKVDEPEAKVDEPEVPPSAPVKPPVNAARVWKAPLPKPGDGDVKGLDGDRPATRKMSNTPRRKKRSSLD